MWTLSSMFLVATKVWKDNYKQKMNNKQGEIQSNNYQQCSFFKYMSKFMVKPTTTKGHNIQTYKAIT